MPTNDPPAGRDENAGSGEAGPTRRSEPLVTMSPEAFAPMDGLPGVAALARDDRFRLLWCNAFYACLCGSTPEAMVGSTMGDHMPAELAGEREDQMRPALEYGRMVAYYQFWHGSRWYTRVWPLDPGAFGTPGVFVIIQSLAQDEATFHSDRDADAPVLVTGQLDELDALSPRELEVFYHIARGLTSAEIAAVLFRSARTVEQHTNQIYKKLGMSSRAQLTRFAVERGVVAFSPEEWDRIVRHRSRG
jgi:DNA-binding CsgD family transcriptional regulator